VSNYSFKRRIDRPRCLTVLKMFPLFLEKQQDRP
jgi:hypothetical protein